MPVFPKEDEDAEDATDTGLQDDPNFHGTQELNGIFIKENNAGGFENQIVSGESLLSPNTKRRITQGKIKETKINFFDP